MATSTACLVWSRRELTLRDLGDVLRKAGLSVDEQPGALAVSWGGPSLSVSVSADSTPDAQTLRVARKHGHACSLPRCRTRVRIEIPDLDAALDESNTLIEVQTAIQALGDGYLVLPWNGTVSAPHRDDRPAKATAVWAIAMKRGIAPLMKGAGFAKKGANFTRTLGSATHRMGFRSRAMGGDVRAYVLDVGWDLRETSELEDSQARVVVAGQPVRFTADVVPDQRSEWAVAPETDVEDLAADLREELTRIVTALAQIDGPASTLDNVDLSAGFDRLARAQLKLVLGDRPGALQDVRSVCAEFPERQGMELGTVLARIGLATLDE